MKNISKQHNSCVRVLEFFKLFFSGDVDIKDINKISNSSFKDIEAHETFLKYIATLEFSGIDIKKIGKQYSLCSTFAPLNLSEKEIDTLSNIYIAFNSCCVEQERTNFETLIDNILKNLDENSKKLFLKQIKKKSLLNHDNLSKIAQNFQKYVDLGQKLKITYHNEIETVSPKSVEIIDKKIYFICYHLKKATNIKFLADDIENIEILPTKNPPLNITESIVFAVYNRLATNYRLREHEKIQDFSDNYKIIINCGEDRQELIRRLLKYGENCKILSPKHFQDEFLEELSAIQSKLQGVLK